MLGEAAGVALVGVDVDFEFKGGIDTDEDLIKRQTNVATDAKPHKRLILDTIEGSIFRRHMDVRCGAYDTLIHLKETGGPHQHTTGRAGNVAGVADRYFETEGDRIRRGEFNLIEIAAWTENTEIGNDATAGPNQGDGLFGSILALLVEPLLGRELMPFAEKHFDRLLR